MEPMVTKVKNRIYQEFSERLHKACDRANLPKPRGRATELGRLMRVSYKGAGKWLDGDGMPGMGHATALAVKLNVSFEWLMTGRGVPELQQQFMQMREEFGEYRPINNDLQNIAQHMPQVVRQLTLLYIEMLQRAMEEQPELFACSKSERAVYKIWKTDFQKLKSKDSALYKKEIAKGQSSKAED